jgi:Holliday junction resolvase RusA-like endonuclease
MPMFQFEIHGDPIPQKQTRFTCACGKGRCYDPSAKDKLKIQWQIKPFAPAEPIAGPVELTIVFFLPIPKGVSRTKRTQMLNRVILPDKKPDEDNFAYLITNALKELVYDDDKRICAKHVYKFYGVEPRTVIRVRPIFQMEQVGYREMDDVQ